MYEFKGEGRPCIITETADDAGSAAENVSGAEETTTWRSLPAAGTGTHGTQPASEEGKGKDLEERPRILHNPSSGIGIRVNPRRYQTSGDFS